MRILLTLERTELIPPRNAYCSNQWAATSASYLRFIFPEHYEQKYFLPAFWTCIVVVLVHLDSVLHDGVLLDEVRRDDAEVLRDVEVHHDGGILLDDSHDEDETVHGAEDHDEEDHGEEDHDGKEDVLEDHSCSCHNYFDVQNLQDHAEIAHAASGGTH